MEKFNVKRRALKQPKPRPIKVVYISNPMKVEASPADFRAVVQELTGQDSDIAYMFGCPSTSVAAKSSCTHAADNESTVDLPVDLFDDAFTSQILEDFRRIQSCDND